MTAILLALGTSLSWGLTNYLGGLQARRIALLSMLLVMQAAGFVTIALVVGVRGVGIPSTSSLATAAATGLVSAVALGAFFKALSLGKFSVVTPIMASGAVIPVLVSIARGERPSTLQGVGIAAIVVGVALAARGPTAADARAANPRAGLVYALVAVVLIGIVLIGLDEAADADPYWAVFALRAATITALVATAVALRHRPRIGRDSVAALILVGILDITGFILLAVATTKGFFSIVAVLGSLYPVVVIALAWSHLGERLIPFQWVGVALTLAGVAMIVTG